jgi:hypothetical protein
MKNLKQIPLRSIWWALVVAPAEKFATNPQREEPDEEDSLNLEFI